MRVKAVVAGGKANPAVEEVLAGALDLSKGDVAARRGLSRSRRKVVGLQTAREAVLLMLRWQAES